MKPSKGLHMVIASSHEIKSGRRTLFGRTPIECTLRFASIFILIAAIGQLSGFFDAVNGVYNTSKTLRRRHANRNTASDSNQPIKPPRKQNGPTEQPRSSGSKHSTRDAFGALNRLYKDVEELTSVEEYLSSKQPPTTSTHKKPTFELEMHWTDENFDDKVCRIHNACMRQDGSLLVHSSMQSHEMHLRACGVNKLEYMESNDEFDTADQNSGFDLFGIQPARYHIPHFLTDVLPMIYASEMVRPQFTKASQIKSVCVAPGGDKRCSRKSLTEALSPSLFVDSRVGNMEVSSWVPQLVAMLPGKPHMHMSRTMFSNSSKTCFRSVVAYRRAYIRRGHQWYGEKNKMFHLHGLTRKSVRDNRKDGTDVGSKNCNLNLYILNRVGWARRGSFLLGRDIVNVQEVVRTVKKLLKRNENKNLRMTVGIEYFENSSFPQQVEVMQKADILLGVHGAGLGNLFFARVDTPILEVLPFSYYAGPFDKVAAALHLYYERVIAEPDTENVLECLDQYAEKEGDDSIATKGRKMWMKAVAKKKEDGDLDDLPAHSFVERSLVPMKLCARSQRMTVDAEETAQRLLRMGQWVCGKQKE